MIRRVILPITAAALSAAMLAAGASAASPIRLNLSQGAAFAILGHSCGGIQEKVYVTGFADNGYPAGTATLSTRCGGSGRGGGYHTTTYTGSADVVWTWFGETRSYSSPGTGEQNPTFSAEDGHNDRIYNENGAAYLQTGEPPLQAPGAPTSVVAAVSLAEAGETEYLSMEVSWLVAPETAPLLQHSTITATPLDNPKATVVTDEVIPYFSSGRVPVEPTTTYRVTVTSTDSEGTSEPSTPIEVKTPNADGEAQKEGPGAEICEQNQGTITLSPGLNSKPKVQTIVIAGELKACDGPLDLESGTYVQTLKTKGKVTCSLLSSSSIEPETTPTSLTFDWLPSEGGTSSGTLTIPITETPLTGISGTLEGGPFSSPTSLSAQSLFESFEGAESCGVKVKHHKATRVTSGTFVSSAVEFG